MAGAAFCVNSDGTVTGLVWDRCSWGQTSADCRAGTVTSRTWGKALRVAVTANAMNSGSGYKGCNDWRLPSKNELESLVDITKTTDPTIGTTAFSKALFAFADDRLTE